MKMSALIMAVMNRYADKKSIFVDLDLESTFDFGMKVLATINLFNKFLFREFQYFAIPDLIYICNIT
jgi:hypothetical protein